MVPDKSPSSLTWGIPRCKNFNSTCRCIRGSTSFTSRITHLLGCGGDKAATMTPTRSVVWRCFDPADLVLCGVSTCRGRLPLGGPRSWVPQGRHLKGCAQAHILHRTIARGNLLGFWRHAQVLMGMSANTNVRQTSPSHRAVRC